MTWGFQGVGQGFSGKLFALIIPYMMKDPMANGLKRLGAFVEAH